MLELAHIVSQLVGVGGGGMVCWSLKALVEGPFLILAVDLSNFQLGAKWFDMLCRLNGVFSTFVFCMLEIVETDLNFQHTCSNFHFLVSVAGCA